MKKKQPMTFLQWLREETADAQLDAEESKLHADDLADNLARYLKTCSASRDVRSMYRDAMFRRRKP